MKKEILRNRIITPKLREEIFTNVDKSIDEIVVNCEELNEEYTEQSKNMAKVAKCFKF